MAHRELDIIGGHLSVLPESSHAVTTVNPASLSNEADGSGGPPKDLRMQSLFDQTVCDELSLPYQYQDVNVLIVRWAQYLDSDMTCDEEVSQLKKVFDNDFNFHTHILELTDQKPPQLQLDTGINGFILDHDGPWRSHLMIIYYTGHGIGTDDGLLISGYREPGVSAIGAKYAAIANWNKAEENLLQMAQADVLVIMDTCCAGNVMKGGTEDIRSFEVLTAAPKNTPTAVPGPRSFSKAMIEALQMFATENSDPFTAYDLNTRIINIRNKQHSQVHTKLNRRSHRHIKLAPLTQPVVNQTPCQPTPEASYLTLRFAFKKITSLSEEQSKTLAKVLSKAASKSKLGINRIEWVEHVESTTGRGIWDTVRLYQAVKQAQRLWRARLTSRKRRRHEEDHEEDGEHSSKRQCQPLTPNSAAPQSNYASPA